MLLLGGKPAPWIGDLSAYDWYFDWDGGTVSMASGEWRTVLSLSGEGWLTFCRGFSGSPTGASQPLVTVRLMVDGVAYTISGNRGLTSNPAILGAPLATPISFRTSLKIEVNNPYSSTRDIGCDYTCLLKTGTPNTNTQSFLLAGTRASFAGVTYQSSTTDAVNITGRGQLLALEFGILLSAVSSPAKLFFSLIVDDTFYVSDRPVLEVYDSSGPQIASLIGPISFNTRLRIQYKVSSGNQGGFIKGLYLLT